ncbi:MAG: hypothetical protein QM770_12770 [Tepidisphaeraceae bacterium]
MTRRSITCLLAAVSLTSIALAQTTQPSSARPSAVPTYGTVKARAVLNARVPSVDLQNVPLIDVIDYLRDNGKLNLFVNWPALEAAGVDRSAPINLKLRQIRASKLLDLTLEQAGGGQLAWYVSDNIIYVTTKELANQQQVTVVYPIQDLIVEVPNFEGPNLSLTSTNSGSRSGGSGGGGGGSSGSQNLFGGSNGSGGTNNNNSEGTTVQERAQHIVDLIQTIVEPDIWDVNGGTARIRFFNGNLIITAPRSAHEKINGPVD